MLPTTQISSHRGSSLRVFFATVTLALVVLTVLGIQSIANRVTASPPQVATVQALGAGQASAAVPEHTGNPAAYAIVVLALLGGGKLVMRLRSTASKHVYWDDMPW